MSDTPRDFASRWSERRRRVREDEAAAREVRSAEPDEEREAMLARNREAAERVDLDTISETTDMSVFLREGVPDLLRRQAMRRLWRSSPVFANVDRLNDYDENFADPSRAMATFQSAWQAGRGYLFPEDEAAGDGKADEALREDMQDGEAVAGASAARIDDAGLAAETPIEGVSEPSAELVGTTDAAATEARNGETAHASYELASKPAPAPPAEENAPAAPSLRARLGL